MKTLVLPRFKHCVWRKTDQFDYCLHYRIPIVALNSSRIVLTIEPNGPASMLRRMNQISKAMALGFHVKRRDSGKYVVEYDGKLGELNPHCVLERVSNPLPIGSRAVLVRERKVAARAAFEASRNSSALP